MAAHLRKWKEGHALDLVHRQEMEFDFYILSSSEIWAGFVIELHSKSWSCHLITLLPHIFTEFKWSQVPTLHSSTVHSETQLSFQRLSFKDL